MIQCVSVVVGTFRFHGYLFAFFLVECNLLYVEHYLNRALCKHYSITTCSIPYYPSGTTKVSLKVCGEVFFFDRLLSVTPLEYHSSYGHSCSQFLAVGFNLSIRSANFPHFQGRATDQDVFDVRIWEMMKYEQL